MTGLVV